MISTQAPYPIPIKNHHHIRIVNLFMKSFCMRCIAIYCSFFMWAFVAGVESKNQVSNQVTRQRPCLCLFILTNKKWLDLVKNHG